MKNLIRVRKCSLYQKEGAAKIYRNTFSANRDLHKQMAQYGEEVYSFGVFPSLKMLLLIMRIHTKKNWLSL